MRGRTGPTIPAAANVTTARAPMPKNAMETLPALQVNLEGGPCPALRAAARVGAP